MPSTGESTARSGWTFAAAPPERPSLEEFLVGDSNRLAWAVCRAVVERPGILYNPLFLYGPPGTGKSHLLWATAAALAAAHPDLAVEATTAQLFAESYIRAAEADELPSFRTCFRNMDGLLVDDLEHLAGKPRSQEELFYTVNELLDTQRQVVVTARTGPAALAGFSAAFKSRLQWGVVVRLDQPDTRLRLALLEAEAKRRSWRLPRPVLALLAERLAGNAREIRGAIVRLQADERLAGRPLTRGRVEAILNDILPTESMSLLERIAHSVMERFRLRLSHLQSKRRNRSVTRPRQVCMFLARQLTPLSLQEIGAYFGGRDHSTVLHSCRKIEQLASRDPALAGMLREIQSELRRG